MGFTTKLVLGLDVPSDFKGRDLESSLRAVTLISKFLSFVE